MHVRVLIDKDLGGLREEVVVEEGNISIVHMCIYQQNDVSVYNLRCIPTFEVLGEVLLMYKALY